MGRQPTPEELQRALKALQGYDPQKAAAVSIEKDEHRKRKRQFRRGDEVTTDYNTRQSSRVRVIEVVEPWPEVDGGLLVTTGPLTIGAYWFKCANCGERAGCVCEYNEQRTTNNEENHGEERQD